MAELLIELLSEEIPARMQAPAARELEKRLADALKAAGLDHDPIITHVTPRRLVVAVSGLPEAQPDLREERRGPRVDAPDKAIEGFLKANGVARDQCEERETPKGNFLFVVIEKKGQKLTAVLPALLGDVITGLSWPKSMRWADHGFRWVRPLRGLVCLLDGHVVDLAIGPVTAGNATVGHRFMAPDPIPVTGFADYMDKLRAARVVVDAAERRAIIADGLAEQAKQAKLELIDDDGLLAEVTGLVEWPVVLLGAIDDQFMDVPAEVLTTAMRTHQKYFSLRDGSGNLAARFLVVADKVGSDGGAAITAGNERVLRARLSDAKFFWDQDRKSPLESRLPALDSIVFHAKLGTLAEKTGHVAGLAAALAAHVPGAEAGLVDRAVRLSKADLVSDMVYEFPELQGIMGRYYARHDGEDDAVARAIADHYSPQGPGDACPTAPVSVVCALADKLHVLAGFWSIDEKPTGSKDPFALRRAALGVIRLILENNLRIPLRPVLAQALAPFGLDGTKRDGIVESLMDFLADRLKVHLRDEGVPHDQVAAVFALGDEDDLVRLMARVKALGDFLGSDDGANLLAAFRRANNIVAIESKKDKTSHDSAPDPALYHQPEEVALANGLDRVEKDIRPLLENEDYVAVMGGLASLRGPVDDFFDRVTVNADDPDLRANRLRLLSRLGGALGQVADFTKLEG